MVQLIADAFNTPGAGIVFAKMDAGDTTRATIEHLVEGKSMDAFMRLYMEGLGLNETERVNVTGITIVIESSANPQFADLPLIVTAYPSETQAA
mmetsp:Transcript_54542/g.109545  ORF Transcript_54542/g.109545 Transcript_54542/m.109545 type:complete len:94 (-) Transcript_54542:28-309(-)